MPFDEFFRKYATTAINHIRPDYKYTTQSVPGAKTLLITMNSGSWKDGFVMLSQSDHRMKGLPPNTHYSLCHILAITYRHGKVVKKIADESYLLQREGSVEVHNSGQGE